MSKEVKFFGEYVEFFPGDKAEAIQYLKSWKKFLLLKLKNSCYEVNLIDEQWVPRESHTIGALVEREGMALKIAVEANFYYELDKHKDAI
jgi:hypothetical protein